MIDCAGASWRGALVAAALWISAVVGVPVAAQEPEAAGADAVVMLSHSGTGAEAPLARAVSIQLANQGLSLVVEAVDRFPEGFNGLRELAARAAAEANAIGVFWCSPDDEAVSSLFFYAPQGDRLVVRTLEGARSEASLESIAVIVGASARSLVSSGPIDVVAEAPAAEDEGGGAAITTPPSSGAPSIAARAERDVAIADGLPVSGGEVRAERYTALDLAYGPMSQFRGAGAVSSLVIGPEIRPIPHLSIIADYVLCQQVRVDRGGVSIALAQHLAWLGLGYRHRIGHWRLSLLAVAELGFSDAEVRVPSDGRKLADAGWEAGFSAGVLGGVRFNIVANLNLYAGIGVRFPVKGTRYVVRDATTAGLSTVLEPLRVQVIGLLGVSVDVI